MRAMILAAGLGTRLRPLTLDRPKALVELNGQPLLGMLIEKLTSYGFDEIIVNVHHFADQVIDYIRSRDYFNISLEISDERGQLLDTGGGLKKASWFFRDQETFLLHNVDVLTDLDYKDMFRHHHEQEALATLAVRQRPSSRYLLFDEQMALCGWENRKSGEKRLNSPEITCNPFAFSGIHVVEPEIFKYLPESDPFSIIDAYLRVSKHHLIKGYAHDEGLWIDLGTPAKLEEAGKIAREKKKK
jgi:NDP-sugar pyrophosphorylase family protein